MPRWCAPPKDLVLLSQSVTLILFNNKGTLQLQGTVAKSAKAEIRFLQLLVKDETVTVVKGDEGAISPCNSDANFHEELDFLKSEVQSLWTHLNDKGSEAEIEELKSENAKRLAFNLIFKGGNEVQSMLCEGQQWVTVGATKQRNKKKKKNKKAESDDSMEHVTTELQKPHTTLLIGDSMVTNIQGN